MKLLPLAAAAPASLLVLSGCKTTGMDLSKMVSAGQNLATAATLSDDEVRALGNRTSAHYDKKTPVAPAGNKHAKRLAKLASKWQTVDGMKLNYKVYLTSEVNAFAVPNGAIRVHAGLLEKFNDDEVRYVIAHEIGHVMLGHSKSQLRTAYAASAVREAAAASNNNAVAAISASELGAIGEAFVNAQFSQKQENEADDYAVDFLRKNGLKADGAVTALRKLETMFGNDRSVFSSHPAPGARAERMAQRLAAR